MAYRWVQLQSDEHASVPAHAHNQEAIPVRSMAPRHLACLFFCTPGRLEKKEQEILSHLLRSRVCQESLYIRPTLRNAAQRTKCSSTGHMAP